MCAPVPVRRAFLARHGGGSAVCLCPGSAWGVNSLVHAIAYVYAGVNSQVNSLVHAIASLGLIEIHDQGWTRECLVRGPKPALVHRLSGRNALVHRLSGRNALLQHVPSACWPDRGMAGAWTAPTCRSRAAVSSGPPGLALQQEGSPGVLTCLGTSHLAGGSSEALQAQSAWRPAAPGPLRPGPGPAATCAARACTRACVAEYSHVRALRCLDTETLQRTCRHH